MNITENDIFGPLPSIDWKAVLIGQRRWEEWTQIHAPGRLLMTPRLSTFEEMAICSNDRMKELCDIEILANRRYE